MRSVPFLIRPCGQAARPARTGSRCAWRRGGTDARRSSCRRVGRSTPPSRRPERRRRGIAHGAPAGRQMCHCGRTVLSLFWNLLSCCTSLDLLKWIAEWRCDIPDNPRSGTSCGIIDPPISITELMSHNGAHYTITTAPLWSLNKRQFSSAANLPRGF